MLSRFGAAAGAGSCKSCKNIVSPRGAEPGDAAGKLRLRAAAGIDAAAGILTSGGTIDGYVKTLEVFVKDGNEKIWEIANCIATCNLYLYTIYVHALKSACANIGAFGLSEAAKVLETAGAQGNLDFIEEHNAKFINGLKSLLGDISRAVSEYGKNSGGGQEYFVDEELLNSELVILKAALDDLDAGVMNAAVERLLKTAPAPHEKGAAVRRIAEHILLADYDEAALLADFLLRGGIK